MNRLSNLPPGVTDYDIEEQAGAFDPEICEDDYIIDLASKGYSVHFYRYDEYFEDFDSAIKAIVERMNSEKFWPNVWQVNDHGNIDLLGINISDDKEINVNIVKSWV